MTEGRAGTDKEGPAHSRREDWLDLAIRALIDNGIDEVKVQVLARKLHVSRSSFYWFFESLKDLHDQLLDHWLSKNTGPIIERATRPAPDIMSAILNVFECWADESLFDPKLDMAIRLWARRSAAVRDIVQQADNRRLSAIAAMFTRHGYEARDAVVRARVLYFTQIGQYTLEVNEPMAVRHANLVPYLRAFSGQEPEAGHVARFEAFLRKNRLLA
jgi:AcrR family transcriptional regulator